MSDEELYRAPPGEVLLHHSHPGRPVHAETNPCPEGRGLYVLDWTDLRNAAPDGARLGAEADALERESRELRAALKAYGLDATARGGLPPRCALMSCDCRSAAERRQPWRLELLLQSGRCPATGEGGALPASGPGAHRPSSQAPSLRSVPTI